jgi:hypothetical protein
MKCIKCGNELATIYDVYQPIILGYKCLNCNLQWTLAEHKDNQNWAVRHIRALEAEIQLLKDQLEQILKKLGV